MQEEYLSEENAKKVLKYEGPVPGQSLTNSTDQKYAWEQAPELTNRREAETYILEELTEKEKFIALTDAVADGLPIDVITRTYLLSGYSRGLWDVDLMMLLVESVGFIIMALAEKVGLDYELYSGDIEEDTEDDKNQLDLMDKATDEVREGIKKISLKSLKLPTSETKEITKQINEIPQETIQEVKGLLDRPQEKEQTSLLGK
jgi:hypothetical protein|tara:strand:+ start:1897 stop:2505 length:609 start_codon:yes stop_codon:yes gene_type:complete